MKLTIDLPEATAAYVERLRRTGLYGPTFEKTVCVLVTTAVIDAIEKGVIDFMDEDQRSLFRPPVGGIG